MCIIILELGMPVLRLTPFKGFDSKVTYGVSGVGYLLIGIPGLLESPF